MGIAKKSNSPIDLEVRRFGLVCYLPSLVVWPLSFFATRSFSNFYSSKVFINLKHKSNYIVLGLKMVMQSIENELAKL